VRGAVRRGGGGCGATVGLENWLSGHASMLPLDEGMDEC
jgi:hypothetical protein